MIFTSEHVGNVFCLYQTGNYIKVLNVKNGVLDYQRESGEHFVSNELCFDALEEKDQSRVALFERHAALGHILYCTEFSAIQKTIFEQDQDEKDVADKLLASVHRQQNFFDARVKRQPPSEMLTDDFLSALYRQGIGSHDTFYGHTVENQSQGTPRFLIDGKFFGYNEARSTLSRNEEFKLRENKRSALSSLINDAKSKKKESHESARHDHKRGERGFG